MRPFTTLVATGLLAAGLMALSGPVQAQSAPPGGHHDNTHGSGTMPAPAAMPSGDKPMCAMCAGMDPAMKQKMMKDMMPAPNDSPATVAFKQAHMKMMHEMGITYSGNADIDFVRGMIPHHQAAIEAANIILKYGKDPENQKLATAIIAAQEREIAGMQAWLAKNAK
jgi:hypothetical protein